LIAYLKHKNIAYTEVDADTPEFQEAIKLSGSVSVPQVHSEKGIVVGLNFGKLAQII